MLLQHRVSVKEHCTAETRGASQYCWYISSHTHSALDISHGQWNQVRSHHHLLGLSQTRTVGSDRQCVWYLLIHSPVTSSLIDIWIHRLLLFWRGFRVSVGPVGGASALPGTPLVEPRKGVRGSLAINRAPLHERPVKDAAAGSEDVRQERVSAAQVRGPLGWRHRVRRVTPGEDAGADARTLRRGLHLGPALQTRTVAPPSAAGACDLELLQ